MNCLVSNLRFGHLSQQLSWGQKGSLMMSGTLMEADYSIEYDRSWMLDFSGQLLIGKNWSNTLGATWLEEAGYGGRRKKGLYWMSRLGLTNNLDFTLHVERNKIENYPEYIHQDFENIARIGLNWRWN